MIQKSKIIWKEISKTTKSNTTQNSWYIQDHFLREHENRSLVIFIENLITSEKSEIRYSNSNNWEIQLNKQNYFKHIHTKLRAHWRENHSNKFAKWDENSNKKHQIHLIRILNSISNIISFKSIIEKSLKPQKSWKSIYISNIIIESFKELAEKQCLDLIQKSYTTNSTQTTFVFYIDKFKCENETTSVVFASNDHLFQLIKKKRAHQSCKIDEITKTIRKNWNLKFKITSEQTELFAIWKFVIWIKNIIQISSYQSKILVFVDNKSTLQCILNKFKKET
jgi:hypothetical protein